MLAAPSIIPHRNVIETLTRRVAQGVCLMDGFRVSQTERRQIPHRETIGALDGWLRFVPEIGVRYDAEQGAERVAALRSAIFVGLALYNAYNLTSIALLRDIVWLS